MPLLLLPAETVVPMAKVSLVTASTTDIFVQSEQIGYLNNFETLLNKVTRLDTYTTEISQPKNLLSKYNVDTYNLDLNDTETAFYPSRQSSNNSLFSLQNDSISSPSSSFTSSSTRSENCMNRKSSYENIAKPSLVPSLRKNSPTESLSDNFPGLRTQRRKSSLSSSITLSPTDKHPLSLSSSPKLRKNEKLDHIPIAFDVLSQQTFPINYYNHSLLSHPIGNLKPSTSNFLTFLGKMGSSVSISMETNQPLFQQDPKPALSSKKHVALDTFFQDYERLPSFPEKVEIDTPDADSLLPIHFFGKTNRAREQRINPLYLLIYSVDKSFAKYLEDVEEFEIDIFDNILLEHYNSLTEECCELISSSCLFDSKFRWKLLSSLQLQNDFKVYDDVFIQQLKLASIARYKLWSTQTLPPRLDDVPNISKLASNITPSASLENCHVPWLHLDDLKNGKAINRLSKSAGFLKNSNIQFVSKNSQSKRWVSYTNEG